MKADKHELCNYALGMITDGEKGSLCILKLHKTGKPKIAATLEVKDKEIMCSFFEGFHEVRELPEVHTLINIAEIALLGK